MDSLYKDNIVEKHFNNLNKKYNSNDVYLLIKSIDPKYGIAPSQENVDILSRRLYILNKLLSKIVQAYASNDKTKLDCNGIPKLKINFGKT